MFTQDFHWEDNKPGFILKYLLRVLSISFCTNFKFHNHAQYVCTDQILDNWYHNHDISMK